MDKVNRPKPIKSFRWSLGAVALRRAAFSSNIPASGFQRKRAWMSPNSMERKQGSLQPRESKYLLNTM
jgi:hypothetical protein